MRPLIQEIQTAHTPESLVENLRGAPGSFCCATSQFDSPSARYSFVAANPFLTFRSFGSRCEISKPQFPDSRPEIQFGNPWHMLDALMARFELLDEIDLPFPLGGCVWLLGLRPEKFHRTQTSAPRRERPGIARLPRRFLRQPRRLRPSPWKNLHCFNRIKCRRFAQRNARAKAIGILEVQKFVTEAKTAKAQGAKKLACAHALLAPRSLQIFRVPDLFPQSNARKNTSARATFIRSTCRNGSRRNAICTGWEFFKKLSAVSPAPFSAFLDCGGISRSRRRRRNNFCA